MPRIPGAEQKVEIARTPQAQKTARGGRTSSEKAPRNSNPSQVQQSISEVLKEIFAPVILLGKIILGTDLIDNTNYENIIKNLNRKAIHSDNPTIERAKEIRDESRKVIAVAQENIKSGKEPWEGLTPEMGVPMSRMAGFLGGDDLRREIYYHNIAAYNWASAQLRRYSNGNEKIEEIISYNDLDNTLSSKPDPADTVEFQSEQKLFWLKEILELSEDLGIKEFGNTARTGLVSNQTALVPEALSKYRARGSLPSFFLERVGYSLESQFDGSDNFGVIALNGTAIHEPHKHTKLAPPLIEAAIFYQIASSPGAPKINGKTFPEALRDIAIENGFSIFEPKALPRITFDSQLSLNKLYFPHYQKIVLLKQEYVDKKLEELNRKGIQTTDKEIANAWLDFREAVKKAIYIGDEIDKDKIWLPGTNGIISDQPSNFYDLLQQFLPNIKVQKSKGFGCIDYKKLLEENPKGFYDVLTSGAEVAFVMHYFNNHGTPVKDAPDSIIKLHDEFSQLPEFRRMLSATTCALDNAFNGRYSRLNFLNFKRKGTELFIEGGAKTYIDWRINNYFEKRFTEDKLRNVKTSSGKNIFNCSKQLSFSKEFEQEGRSIYEQEGLKGYIKWLKKEFEKSGVIASKINPVIETFLPEENKCTLEQFDAKEKENRVEIATKFELAFYPNDFYEINSKEEYNGLYHYAARVNIVDKRNPLNPYEQCYKEVQPDSEKQEALKRFNEALDGKILSHVAGDSESDVGMMAKALELGGFIDIVFNQFQDRRIFNEVITQRLKYDKIFKRNNELYQECREKLGIYALEKNKQTGKYRKIISFNEDGSANCGNREFSEEELEQELYQKYKFKIIRNASPEAYIRRKIEIFGLLTGKNIEFNSNDLKRAEEYYKRKQAGEKLSSEEKRLLFLYEYSVIRKYEGSRFPAEAPHFNIYYEWHGTDSNGDFVVYKSKKFGGRLIVVRNGSEPKLFEGGEKALTNLHKVEISNNNNTGTYVYLNERFEEVTYTDIERLNDHKLENRILPKPSSYSGIFGSKFLRSLMGEKNLKRLACNLPILFQGLLKYSGLVMGIGGLVRILSPLTFDYKDSVYKAGYVISNSTRAISAFGGALRGILNVNRYWNIALGEVLNIVASFLNDGSKHALLGLGNFVLFLGRGQQAAQRQQRVNNHPENLLTTNPKSRKFKELLAKYVDPRTYVRNVTKLSTGLITTVKEEVAKNGLKPLIGEISGSILSAVVTPIRMLADLIKDPRLILQIVRRQSEKSGGFYKAVPSPGHLMTLVGAISGISAIAAGTIGRIERFGDVAESGFNKIGRWATSIACGIPAIGIMANAKEIMANIDGLPKIYRGLNGKDVMYNPRAAGALQFIAGIGFAFSSLFDLSKKNTAPWFDIANALYFSGASIEEGPNMHKTTLSELRASNKLYESTPSYLTRNINFNNAA